MEYFVTDDGKYRIESLTPATAAGALRDGFTRGLLTTDAGVTQLKHIYNTWKKSQNAIGVFFDISKAFGCVVIELAFIKDEQLITGSEVNKNPNAIKQMLELMANFILDGVSLVAIAVNTGEVVATFINQIAIKDKELEIFSQEMVLEDSFVSLMTYVADIEHRSNIFEIYNVDCCFELFAVGTLKEHRQQKLGTLLWKYSIEVARKMKDGSVVPIRVADLGPKYSHLKDRAPIDKYPEICNVLCTVGHTQKIAKEFGFNLHLTVQLSELEYNGMTYSERIGDENACCQKYALRL